jgi:hypothetical protein
MPTQSGPHLVELLHLAFLQVLPSHLPLADYVVKGGANLRLFFDSRRRSQSIDFDFVGRSFWSVERKIDAALQSRAYTDLLRVANLQMLELTKPKQTDTTRRWKFVVTSGGAHLNSKIEFSARRPDPEYTLDTARADIGRDVGLRAVRCNHYAAPAAIRQKIRALAGRKQTEPRDVFDLDLLLAKFPNALLQGNIEPAVATKAANAAFDIEFDAYRDLVVEFLEEEFVEIYDRPEVWEEMVTRVASFLESVS